MSNVDLDLLVVECVERMELEGAHVLDELCTAHPGIATELRRAVQPLVDMGVVQQPAPSSFAEGTIIGGYEIVREVGRGGMGVVFEARDEQVGRSVALKIIRSSVDLDNDLAVRFRREAEAAGALRHPGLVQVHAAGIHEGQPWLAMEFIDGVGLDAVIRHLREDSRGLDRALRAASGGENEDPASLDDKHASTGLAPSELRRRVELILEVAEALEEVHQHDIVHRDVKPSNIFVRADGRAVLGDFGLARRVNAPGLTQTGVFAGTPFYASPEQVEGRSDLGPATDVFSLGVTLYEILTLNRPFTGDSTRDILNAIEAGNPIDPARAVPRLPDELAAITLKALAKDRGERYRDATEFAADLRAFLEFRPVAARRANAWGRLRRWMRREPMQAAFATVVLLGGLVLAGLTGSYLAQRPLAETGRRTQSLQQGESAITRGFLAYLRHDYEHARPEFDTALRLLPDNELAIVGRILSEVRQSIGADGGGDVALAALERHLTGDPSKRESRVFKRLEMVLRFISRDFVRVKKLETELGPPATAAEYFLHYFVLPGKRRDDKQQMLDAAIRCSDRPVQIFYILRTSMCESDGDFLTCVTLARTIRRLWPDDASSWAMSALAATRFSKKVALRYHRKTMAMDPEDLGSRLGLVQFLTRHGDLAEADKEAMKCLAIQPNDAAVLENVALLRSKQERLDEAIELANRATERAIESGLPLVWDSALRLAVRLLRRQGNLEEAITRIRAAIALEPRVIEYQMQLVKLLLEAKDLGAAKTEADILVSRFAPRSSTYVERARVFEALGDDRAALADLQESCKLEPNTALLRRNLAWVLVKLGQRDKALVEARRAVVLSKYSDAAALHCLGELLLSDGELDDAERYLKLGLEILDLPGPPGKNATSTRSSLELALQQLDRRRR